MPGIGAPAAPPGLVIRMAEAFAFSSGLAASVGAALTVAASLAFDGPETLRTAFLAASGTFIIYNLDRLRDLDRDRITSPRRTDFVRGHRRLLYLLVGSAAIGFAGVLRTGPPALVVLCFAIGCVGLFHRRMKRFPAWKATYVSVSWSAACVGLPWLGSRAELSAGAWVSALFVTSLAANLIASNLRDDEAMSFPDGHRIILWIARAFVVVAILIAAFGPSEFRALVWIPVFEGLALSQFRRTERYGHLAVDGALLLGALGASIQLGWPT